MKRFVFSTAVIAAVLVATPADALKITNQDTVDQTLTIIEADNESKLTLNPGQYNEGVCNSGCIIRMQNGDEYEFEGTEGVIIEGEQLFLEELAQGDGATPNPDAPRNQ